MMSWRDATFLEALHGMLKEFDRSPESQSLALIWRAPNEWNVLDIWLLRQILQEMNEETLRVVLWLTRNEAIELTRIIAGGK